MSVTLLLPIQTVFISANSADHDQTAHLEQSDQGKHCLTSERTILMMDG